MEGSFLHTSDAIEEGFVALGCTIFFAFIGGGIEENVSGMYLSMFAARLSYAATRGFCWRLKMRTFGKIAMILAI